MEAGHFLIGLALRIKARKEGGDAPNRIRQALRPGHRQATFEAVDDFILEKDARPLMLALAGAGVSQIGDGHILEMILAFLDAHWADILPIILKLLGL